MPHYEFSCHNCKESFSKVLTLAQYEKGKLICPALGQEESRAELVRLLRLHFEEERLIIALGGCTVFGQLTPSASRA